MGSAVPHTARFSTRARLSAAAVACALLGGVGSLSATAATAASGAPRESTTAPTGTAWYYEGGTLGYRVVHFYFPRSGIIIAVATNSSTALGTSDDLQATAIAVYQTLEKAGAVQPS